MGKSYAVRVRLDCERYDFILGRRVLDIFEEHEFDRVEECVSFIDSLLKSSEFADKYYAYKLRLEILRNYEVVQFITVHLSWNKETTFLFTSDENLLPLKEEYYHKKQESSIWGPAPEW